MGSHNPPEPLQNHTMTDTAPPPFVFHQGTAPLLISMPHAGTHVPPDIAARLTEDARHVPDTDWHLPRLYEFARAMGASILVATHSRYVVDLNRPPDGASLYPPVIHEGEDGPRIRSALARAAITLELDPRTLAQLGVLAARGSQSLYRMVQVPGNI